MEHALTSTSRTCSPAAWSWSASCCCTRTGCSALLNASPCMPSCWRSRWPGRRSSRTRRTCTSPRDRPAVQGDRHPGRAAPHHRSASASTARSRPWSGSARPCWPAWAWWRSRSWSCCRSPADADPLAREDLAFALSVVLLGLLMMVTRRNAVSQVIGFMSLENGLILAATGAKGMPLVVEISVAFSILIAFIVIGIFLFRIRERFDTVDVQALETSAASARERARLVRARRGARHPCGRRRDPGAAAGLSPDRAPQRRRFAADLPHGAHAVRARARSRAATCWSTTSTSCSSRSTPSSRFTTSCVQRELHRPRARDRPPHAGLPALLPRHVSDPDVRHEPRAGGEQHRADVGGDRDRDADHRADGRHLPHATRRSRPPGNTSSSAASASRWRCSARSSSTWRRARWSAKAWTRWRGACW